MTLKTKKKQPPGEQRGHKKYQNSINVFAKSPEIKKESVFRPENQSKMR